jgi:hypothetical protein
VLDAPRSIIAGRGSDAETAAGFWVLGSRFDWVLSSRFDWVLGSRFDWLLGSRFDGI